MFQRLEQNGIESSKDARDLAATSQHVFNLLLTEQITKFLDVYQKDNQHPYIDGIVLTGGCALVGVKCLKIWNVGGQKLHYKDVLKCHLNTDDIDVWK